MTVLTCPDDFEIDLYLDGELGPEESAAISRHIETCPRCRERIESETRFREALRQIPVVAPPPEFSDRLVRMALQWALQERSGSVPSGYAPAISETVSQNALEGSSRGIFGRVSRWVGGKTAAFVQSLLVGPRDFFARLEVRRAVAMMLTVIAVFVQIYLGALGIGGELGNGSPPGMEVLDEAVAFLRTFSFREFMKHVSELRRAFQAGGSDTAVIAMKAFFGTESLITIILGTGLVLVVTWRKRRVRFSED